MIEGGSLVARLAGLEAHLRSRIRGQDRLVTRIASVLARGEMGLADSRRPRGSFLFVGPTGTGKTELALCFTEYLFGADRLARFDMSEYQAASGAERMTGENSRDPGLLGRVLARMEHGTLLFDEMEKAHPRVLDLFLQMLDAARITLATGETKSVAPFYLVFTSNLGAAEAIRMERSSRSSVEASVLRRVEQELRPELVGRIDEKVVFARLSPDVQREICELNVAREVARLHELGYDLSVSREAIEFLLREGYHARLGARPMRRAVERHLQEAVVRDLFASGIGAGRVGVAPNQRGLCVERF